MLNRATLPSPQYDDTWPAEPGGAAVHTMLCGTKGSCSSRQPDFKPVLAWQFSQKKKKKNKPPNNTTKPSNNPSAPFPLFSHFLMVGFDSLLHKILKKRSLCSWLPSVVVIKLAHTNQGWVFCCYFLINNQLTMQPIWSNNAFCKQLAFLKTTLWQHVCGKAFGRFLWPLGL